ncbi:MAG: amidohydrolase family protein [Sphingomonadaceae bacterium]|nr:amidohydrolase family protein [Sphingomonadaceae bacterium]
MRRSELRYGAARLALSALLALAIQGCTTPKGSAGSPFDIVITGGEMINGDGRPLGNVDIAIRNGRIIRVAPGLAREAKSVRVINAQGQIVAPGFIDPHTHADGEVFSSDEEERANLAYAYQGVTTVVVGNDGQGITDFPTRAAPAGTNYAVLAGFGGIRREVLGEADRAPNDAELEQMRLAVRRDMCGGALGLSAGLYYFPQSFAKTDEVVVLARDTGRLGGYYDTHLRDEGDFTVGVIAALDEALEIGRRAQIPVHLSHIKALGPAVWGQSEDMIERVEAAQATGQIVTADQYPWRASGTRISSALVPRWALDGGMEALRGRLRDPATEERIASEIAANIARRGGPESLLITGEIDTEHGFSGKTLGAVAGEWDTSPQAAAIRILQDGDARLASFNMSPDDIAAFAGREWVMTGSDGSAGHPRKYATYPKAWQDWVRGGAMAPGRFIRLSSGKVADTIGLKDRGYLAEGYAADIVIFDSSAFLPLANYSAPKEYARGVSTLIVNGEVVIEAGKYTGALPGRLLKGQPPGGMCDTVQGKES